MTVLSVAFRTALSGVDIAALSTAFTLAFTKCFLTAAFSIVPEENCLTYPAVFAVTVLFFSPQLLSSISHNAFFLSLLIRLPRLLRKLNKTSQTNPLFSRRTNAQQSSQNDVDQSHHPFFFTQQQILVIFFIGPVLRMACPFYVLTAISDVSNVHTVRPTPPQKRRH